jgi:hypothetical protein
MADDREEGTQSGGAPEAGEQRTGDPGRTPGKAEGDEETVDESLRQKEDG